jgi:hypothetical protein
LSITASIPVRLPSQLDHGNAAPARADHDHILLDQKFDEARFKDFERGRRCHHALPAIGICGDPPAALGCQGACFALGIGGTDRLSRLAKGRITAINPDLRQKGSDQGPAGQHVHQLPFDQIADHAGALCIQHIKRLGDVRRGRRLKRQQPDLCAVAVCHHHLMAGGADRCQSRSRVLDATRLMVPRQPFDVRKKGAVTKGKDNAHVLASC